MDCEKSHITVVVLKALPIVYSVACAFAASGVLDLAKLCHSHCTATYIVLPMLHA